MQTLENKALSRGIIEKSAPILAEITIRKSQEIELRRGGGGCGHSILPQSELSRWVDGGTLYGKWRAETSPRRLSSGFYKLNRPHPYRRFADTAPCRPAILDLKAIGITIDLVRIAKTPAVVVLNAVPPRGTLTREAGEAVGGYGIPLAPVSFGHRSAFVHALTAGATAQEYEPHSKAAQEVTKLYTWICRQVGM